MVADLKAWVRQLMLIVILVGVVEMLLPDASMKRYARASLGLLVLLSILVPFLSLLHQEVRWAEAFSAQPAEGYGEHVPARESLEQVGRDLTLSVFRSQVARRVEQTAQGIPGVSAAGARVEVESAWDSPRFGTIRSVELLIRPGERDGTPFAGDVSRLREEVAEVVARDLGMGRDLVKVQIEAEGGQADE